jgi:hypothetical protein
LYRTAPLAGLICAAVALASCGGGGSSSAGTTTSGAGAAKVKSGDGTQAGAGGDSKGAAMPEATTTASPTESGCSARLGEFVSRMDDLRQSLLAGLSYAEYVVRVKAIHDAYEAIPVDRLGAACLAGAAAHAEDAFNQYLRAANTWGKCAGTAGCAASEIEGKLQHRWRIASKSLEATAHDQRD